MESTSKENIPYDSNPEFKHLSEEEKEEIASKFDMESEFMPEKGFYKYPANLQLRKVAVSTIATHCKGEEVDAFIPYMAMKYFDYFFSREKNKKHDSVDNREKYSLDLTNAEEILEKYSLDLTNAEEIREKYSLDLTNAEEISKVATTCLMIAAKTREGSADSFMASIPVHMDIDDMELHIENQLPWETYPITPFYFLDYFYPLFEEETDGFRRRGINEIIVQAQGEEEFVTYDPSHIALSSFAAAADILYPTIHIEDVTESIRMAAGVPLCVRMLAELCIEKNIKILSASSSEVMPHHAAANVKGKGKGKMPELDQILEEDEEEHSMEMFRSEAPKSLMKFVLQWPTEITPRPVPQGIDDSHCLRIKT